MFRMLLRSEQQVEAIARLEDASNLNDEVHANIIAGLALDDGQTIVAWLPDAEAEFGPSIFAANPPEAEEPQVRAPLRKQRLKTQRFPFSGGMFGSADLTVIGPDGKRLEAEYVGLDGVTGLSILRLKNGDLKINDAISAESVAEGENVRLLNPEPSRRSLKHLQTVGPGYTFWPHSLQNLAPGATSALQFAQLSFSCFAPHSLQNFVPA